MLKQLLSLYTETEVEELKEANNGMSRRMPNPMRCRYSKMISQTRYSPKRLNLYANCMQGQKQKELHFHVTP